MKSTEEGLPPLNDREIRFFASHFIYHLAANEELSISLIQRRFLLGFRAAVLVHDYILMFKKSEHIEPTSERHSDAIVWVELTLLVDPWFAAQLLKKPLADRQVLLDLGDTSKLTAKVHDTSGLDRWLQINSDSIFSVEKRFL
mgnify:CR=1 FL=1